MTNIEAPWVTDYYDEYRNRYYGFTEKPEDDEEEENDG